VSKVLVMTGGRAPAKPANAILRILAARFGTEFGIAILDGL
jgi:hypothetical protein